MSMRIPPICRTVSFLLCGLLFFSPAFSACGSETPVATAPNMPAVTIVSDPAAGLAYLNEAASGDTAEVERAIKAARQERLAAELQQQHLDAVEDFQNGIASGQIDVWSLFYDACILGDSRSEPFSYLGFLPEERVRASVGAHVTDALNDLDDVVSLNPSVIFFTYGLNSTDGESGLERFIDACREVLSQYASALPDTTIYVCAILPVQDIAYEEEPGLSALPLYNEALQNMSAQDGYEFLDGDTLFPLLPDYYEQDGIHFIADFYPIWAAYLMESVYVGAEYADTTEETSYEETEGDA